MSRVRGCPNVYWENVMCTASTQNLAVLSGRSGLTEAMARHIAEMLNSREELA
jgi:hypothetical protein